MRVSVLGSFTINLSLGLLPVRAPVVVEKAPLLAIIPSLFSTAKVMSSSVGSSSAEVVWSSLSMITNKYYRYLGGIIIYVEEIIMYL